MDGATRPSPPRSAKSIVVVGAGVTGLVCARALLEAGLNVIVVEAAHNLFPGPPASRFSACLVDKYPDLARLFSLPEFKPPTGSSPDDLHRYLLSYVEHFQLRKHIIFSCKLEHAQVGDDGRWCIVCSDLLDPQRLHRLTSDFLVISAGACLAPSLPQLQGCADFVGCRLDARNLLAAEAAGEVGPLLSGKHVLVAGDDRTAVQCARLAERAGAHSVTLLYRQPHWPLPHKLLGCTTPKIANRRCLPSVLFPPYYTAGQASRALSSVLNPLRRLFWWRLERRLARKYGVDEATRPPVDIMRDMFYSVQASVEEDNWVGVLQGSSVRLIRGDICRLGPDYVLLKDGSSLHANVVVHCSAHTRNFTVFDPELQASLGLRKDGLHLYRSLVPPAVPSLAFLGCETSSPFAWLTASLQAQWVARLASGRLVLPGLRHMKADVYLQRRWRRRTFPPQHNRGSLIQWYAQAYHDQLMRDMGLEPNVKGPSRCLPLWSACSTYTPADYRPVFTAAAAAAAADGIRRSAHARCTSPSARHLLPGTDLLSAEASEGSAAASARTSAQPAPPSSSNAQARRAVQRGRSQDWGRQLSTDAASRAVLAQVSVTSNASRLQVLLGSRASGAVGSIEPSNEAADRDVTEALDLLSSVHCVSIPVVPPNVGRSGLSYSAAGGAGGPSLRGSSIGCSRLGSMRGSAMSASAASAAACAAAAAGGNSTTAGSARISGGGITGDELTGHSHPEIEPDGQAPSSEDTGIAAAVATYCDPRVPGKASRPQLQPQPRRQSGGAERTARGESSVPTIGTGAAAAGVPGKGGMSAAWAGGSRHSSGALPLEPWPGSPVRLPVGVGAVGAAEAPCSAAVEAGEDDGGMSYLPLPLIGDSPTSPREAAAAASGTTAIATLSLMPLRSAAGGTLHSSQGALHQVSPAAGGDPWATSASRSDMVVPSPMAPGDVDSVPAANSLSLGLPHGRAGPGHGGAATPLLAGAVFSTARASASASGRTGSTGQWPSSPHAARTAIVGGGGGGCSTGGSGVQSAAAAGVMSTAGADASSGACSSGAAGLRHRDIGAMLPPAMLQGYEVIEAAELLGKRQSPVGAAAAAQPRSQEFGEGQLPYGFAEEVPYDARYRPVDTMDDESLGVHGRRRSLDAAQPAASAVRPALSAAAVANALSATTPGLPSGGGTGSGLLATAHTRGNTSAALLAARGAASRNSSSGTRSVANSALHRPSQLGMRSGGDRAPFHGSLASDALADLLDSSAPRHRPMGLVSHLPSGANSVLLFLQDRPSPAARLPSPAAPGHYRAGAASGSIPQATPPAMAAVAAAALGGNSGTGGAGSGSFPSSGTQRKARRSSAVVFSNVLGNEDFMQLLLEAGTNDGRPEGVIDVRQSRSILLQGSGRSEDHPLSYTRTAQCPYRPRLGAQLRGEGPDSIPHSQLPSPQRGAWTHLPRPSREGSEMRAGSSGGLRSATLKPAVQGHLGSSVILVHGGDGGGGGGGGSGIRGSISGAIERGSSTSGAATATGYTTSVVLPASGRPSRPSTVANGTAAAAAAAFAASRGRTSTRTRGGFATSAGYIPSLPPGGRGGSGLLRCESPRLGGSPRGSLRSIELPQRGGATAGHVSMSGASLGAVEAVEAPRRQHPHRPQESGREQEHQNQVCSSLLVLDTFTPMSQQELPPPPPEQQHKQQQQDHTQLQEDGQPWQELFQKQSHQQRPPMQPPALAPQDQRSSAGWFWAVPELEDEDVQHSQRGGAGTGAGSELTGQQKSPRAPRTAAAAADPHAPAKSSSLLLDGSESLAASLGTALATLNASLGVPAAAGVAVGALPLSRSTEVGLAAGAAGGAAAGGAQRTRNAALVGSVGCSLHPAAVDAAEGGACAAAAPGAGAEVARTSVAGSPLVAAGAQGGALAGAGAQERSASILSRELKRTLCKQALRRGWHSLKTALGFRTAGDSGSAGSGGGSSTAAPAVAAAPFAAAANKAFVSAGGAAAAVPACPGPSTASMSAGCPGLRNRSPLELRVPSWRALRSRGCRAANPHGDARFAPYEDEADPDSPTAAAAVRAAAATAAAAALHRPGAVGRSQSYCLPRELGPSAMLAGDAPSSPYLLREGSLPYSRGGSFTTAAAAGAAVGSLVPLPPAATVAAGSTLATSFDSRSPRSSTRDAAAAAAGLRPKSTMGAVAAPSRLNSNVSAAAGVTAHRGGGGGGAEPIEVDTEDLTSLSGSLRALSGPAPSQAALVSSGQDSEGPPPSAAMYAPAASGGVLAAAALGGGAVGTSSRRRLPPRQRSGLALAVDATAAILAAAAAGSIAVPCIPPPTHVAGQGPTWGQGCASVTSTTGGGGTGTTPSSPPPPGASGSESSTGPSLVLRISSAVHPSISTAHYPQLLPPDGRHGWEDGGGGAGGARTLYGSLRAGGSMRNMYMGLLSPPQREPPAPLPPQQQCPLADEQGGGRSCSAQGYYLSVGPGSGGCSPHDSGLSPFVTDSFESSLAAGGAAGPGGVQNTWAGPGAGVAGTAGAGPRPRAPPRRRQSLLRTLLSSTNNFVAGAAAAAATGGSGGGTSTSGAAATLRCPSGGPVSPAAGRLPVRRPPKRVLSELPQMLRGGGGGMPSLGPEVLGGQQRRTPFGRSGSPPSVCLSPTASSMAAPASTAGYGRGSVELGGAVNSPVTSAFGGGGGDGRARRPLTRRDSVINNLLVEMAEAGSLLDSAGAHVQYSSGRSAAATSVVGCSAAMAAAAAATAFGTGFDPHAPEGVLAWERPAGWDEMPYDAAGGSGNEATAERRTATLAAAAAAGMPSVILGHLPPPPPPAY